MDGVRMGAGMAMGVTGWSCLPLSMALAAGVALLVARLGRRVLTASRAVSLALLLPGLCLALWPVLPPSWSPFPGAGTGHHRLLLVCRVLGTLPLLLLPVLAGLARMPSGQVRTASGLGAGPWMRLRLLWLPQLGPACLLGLALAVTVDATSLSRAGRMRPAAAMALSPHTPPS